MAPQLLVLLLSVVLFAVSAPALSVGDESSLLTVGSTANSSAFMDPEEVEAVHQVMAAAGNSWVSQIPDVCRGRWHGIECVVDRSTNTLHVVSLSLGVLSEDTAYPGCSSEASLSPSISKLTYLRRIFFYNCFTGNSQHIPAEIGKLGASLESLILRGNGLVGPVPPELANLTKLEILDLHGNNLTSALPPELGRLSSLRKLDLSNSGITGTIPSTLGELSEMKILDLSNNRLHGEIPDMFSGLSHLRKLDLSNNELNGSIPRSVGELKSVVFIDLSSNDLGGGTGIPSSFSNLSELQVLILKNTKLGSPIPRLVGNLTNLQILVLSSSSSVGRIPSELGRLKKLKVLHLDNNELVGPIPDEVVQLSQLSELNVAQNGLSGPVAVPGELVHKLGGHLRLMNNSGLCIRSHEHHLDVVGVDKCSENFDDYRDPSQISLPAIIIPSEPAVPIFNSGSNIGEPSLLCLLIFLYMWLITQTI